MDTIKKKGDINYTFKPPLIVGNDDSTKEILKTDFNFNEIYCRMAFSVKSS